MLPVTQENLSRHREGELKLSRDFAKETESWCGRGGGLCYESAVAKKGS